MSTEILKLMSDTNFHSELEATLKSVNPLQIVSVEEKLDDGYFDFDNENIVAFIRNHTILKSLLFIVDAASCREDVDSKLLKKFFWCTVIDNYVKCKKKIIA